MYWLPLFIVGLSVSELKEMNDREIAVSVSDKISGHVSDKDFLACVPRESVSYPKVWSAELQDRVFEKDAMSDLMNCSLKNCAFNFLEPELEIFQTLKSKDERRSKYMSFYADRVSMKTGLDPERTPFFLRSFKQPFEDCRSKELDELLDQRPSKKLPFRLSHVHYSRRMRPTTRLTQSVSYPLDNKKAGLCYAEALIFSDHYDLDRVELWKMERAEGEKKTSQIEVSVRHRIDLLSTWFRRLNKKALRDELKGLLETQMQEATTCLQRQGTR